MAVKSGVFVKYTAETGGKNNKNRSFYRRIQGKVSRLQCIDSRSLMTAAVYSFVKSSRMNFRGWNGRSGTGRSGISSSYFS